MTRILDARQGGRSGHSARQGGRERSMKEGKGGRSSPLEPPPRAINTLSKMLVGERCSPSPPSQAN